MPDSVTINAAALDAPPHAASWSVSDRHAQVPEQRWAQRMIAAATQVIDLPSAAVRYAYFEVPARTSWAQLQIAAQDHAQLYLGWRPEAEVLSASRIAALDARGSHPSQPCVLVITAQQTLAALSIGAQDCVRFQLPDAAWTVLFAPNLTQWLRQVQWRVARWGLGLMVGLGLGLSVAEWVLMHQQQNLLQQVQAQTQGQQQRAQQEQVQQQLRQAEGRWGQQWQQWLRARQALQLPAADASYVVLQSVQWQADAPQLGTAHNTEHNAANRAPSQGVWTLGGSASSESAAQNWLQRLRTEGLQGSWQAAAVGSARAQAHYAFSARWRGPEGLP